MNWRLIEYPVNAQNARIFIPPIYASASVLPPAASARGSFAFLADTQRMVYSTGAAWVDFASGNAGLTIKGSVAFNAAEPSSPAAGDLYFFTNAGSNTWEGTTPVQAGDMAIYTGSAWSFIQGNSLAASDTVAGVVELATTAETNTGTDATRAVTPAGLAAYFAGLTQYVNNAAAISGGLTAGKLYIDATTKAVTVVV